MYFENFNIEYIIWRTLWSHLHNQIYCCLKTFIEIHYICCSFLSWKKMRKNLVQKMDWNLKKKSVNCRCSPCNPIIAPGLCCNVWVTYVPKLQFIKAYVLAKSLSLYNIHSSVQLPWWGPGSIPHPNLQFPFGWRLLFPSVLPHYLIFQNPIQAKIQWMPLSATWSPKSLNFHSVPRTINQLLTNLSSKKKTKIKKKNFSILHHHVEYLNWKIGSIFAVNSPQCSFFSVPTNISINVACIQMHVPFV